MACKLGLGGGIALVTGAAAGIGKETAFAFAEAGAEGVVFADINEKGAHDAAEESKKYATNAGFRPLVVKAGITDELEVQNMVDTTIREFGRIDYSVNSAGMGNISGAVVSNLKVDVFSKTMETNIKGTMLCVRAVAKAMSEQEPRLHTSRRHGERSLGRGSIVNLGSINSFIAAPGMLSYTTSKHAIVGLTKSADTPMNEASLKRVPELAKMIQAISPLRRVAKAEEVADYIVFLCSPSASYINGTGLCVDAGITMSAHAI